MKVASPTGEDLLEFLGQSFDPATLNQAEVHVEHVTSLVKLYVRGNGMPPNPSQGIEPALRAVIIGAAARTMGNPDDTLRTQVGNYSEMRAQFTGWTLPELNVLHHFRKRTA